MNIYLVCVIFTLTWLYYIPKFRFLSIFLGKVNFKILFIEYCENSGQSINAFLAINGYIHWQTCFEVCSSHQYQTESRISKSLINVHLSRFDPVAVFSHSTIITAGHGNPLIFIRTDQSTDEYLSSIFR